MCPDELNCDDEGAASIDGVEVEEISDADSVRFFVREWQWRARMHFGDRSMAMRRSRNGSGIIDS
jgi:hypothetical protein